MHDPSRGPRGGPGWSGRAFVTLGLGCAVAASLTGCPSSEPSSTSLFDLADVVAETDASDPECANDDACQPESADPCRTWTCEAGSCKVEDRPDGEACDGDRAWLGQACAAGVCAGGTARYECDVIAFEGCCTPEGDLFFCDDDALTWHGCNGGGCGWDDQGELYDCDRPSAASDDPDVPYLCPEETCETPCAGLSCGTDCGVDCGTCADGTETCEAGQCVACSCDGLACGDDGCGSSCGTCESQASCQAGSCVSECGDLTAAGCCTGALLTYCNQLGQVSEITCSPETCGWNPDPAGAPEGEGWYDCGFEGEDPSGEVSATCPADTGGGG